MQDFEKKECRSYLNHALSADMVVDTDNIQLADIEVDNNIMLAVHRT